MSHLNIYPFGGGQAFRDNVQILSNGPLVQYEKKYLYDLEENTIVETQSSCLNNYTTKTEIVGEYRFVIKELVKRGIMLSLIHICGANSKKTKDFRDYAHTFSWWRAINGS